ncbi:MAG: ATP-dependent DNA helicase [Gammaproteobacteria bacterium]
MEAGMAATALGPEGEFAAAIKGFAPREQQILMAEAVELAIAEAKTLVVEAGTGVGKTFAYLVPAVLSRRKTIVSTGTRNLQDQLFDKDLPIVRETLGVPFKAALLKGRANYLCLHRLEEVDRSGRLGSREEVRDLARIRAWAGVTHAGDIAEITDVPEDSAIWPRVTSTTDNCLGQDCPQIDDCHVIAARRAAQAADLVVVNHHLLCADLSLKEDGFGEILPAADVYVVDEAHQLPDVASSFFGRSLSSRQMVELCRDCTAEYLREAADMADIGTAADALERTVLDLRLLLGPEGRRAAWRTLENDSRVSAGLADLEAALDALERALEPAAERGKGLESCHRRVVDAQSRMAMVTAPDDGEGQIRWYETYRRSFAIHLTPMDVAMAFQERLPERPSTWIHTSATLAINGRFAYFADQLGLDEPAELLLDSPFDYKTNALFYVPDHLPMPNEPGFTAQAVEAALPVLEASGGRAFMLFTSYRALDEAAELLNSHDRFPLFVQGAAPKGQLLEAFRASGNGVLLGTSSFWEGVDVRGEALSCVIIDKLPFASPGDPVLQARIDAMRRSGQDPFQDYQLPRAVIMLKQGVGRLIRDVADRGVLMLCDRRLLLRNYGFVFLNSLPDTGRTRSLERVQRFLGMD